MRCYLIRHGITKGNTALHFNGSGTDEPLTQEGREALKEIEGVEPDSMLFASPMTRALETADILFHGREPAVIDDLREMHFGVFEGKNHKMLDGNPEYQAWLDVQAETDPETAPAPAAADKGEILQRQCARCEEILAESTANAKIWMNEKIKAEDAIQSYQNSEQYEESLQKYTKSASEHYKQQISELETVLAQAEVKAPCSGVVTDVFCLEGEPGRQFTPAIVIGRTDAFEAVLTVSAETRMKLRVNMPVWLTVSTAPEQTINGTVTEIRQTVQNDYEVRVSVDTDANNMMRSGVSCSAKIILEQSEQTLSVPYDAVMSDESGEYVWRMQDGNPVRQNVQTGLHCGYYTEIIDNGALKPQDEILLNPEDILGEKAS